MINLVSSVLKMSLLIIYFLLLCILSVMKKMLMKC
jgi:hypothetical protein